MNLNAQHVLMTVASLYQEQQATFSRSSIHKTLEEVKYLSSQKKIPRLTLRKEVLHLEDQLRRIFALEQQFLKQKKEESAKVLALKQQIKTLQQKFILAEDKGLQRKVDHLSHLLGECLAQLETNIPGKEKEEPREKELSKELLDTREVLQRLRLLQQRLLALKEEVDITKNIAGKNPLKIKDLEQQIKDVETRMQQFFQQEKKLSVDIEATILPPPQPERGEVKHRILLGPPVEGMSLQQQLMPPPQPKREN